MIFRASWNRVSLAGLLAAALPLAACGGGVNGSPSQQPDAGPIPSTGVTALSITPSSATVQRTGAAPGTASFRAHATYSDGSVKDASVSAFWSVTPSTLGTISNGTFTAGGAAGQGTIMASFAGQTATATVTVAIAVAREESGAPSNSPAIFSGAGSDPTRAPAIVYPYDGVLVPPNLGGMEIQWNPGSGGGDLYDVSIKAPPYTDVEIYTTQPKYQIEPDVWALIAAANHDSSVSVTVSGTVMASPSTAGTSSPVRIQFAGTTVSGGIYYWSADPTDMTKEGIFRYDFASGGSGKAFYGESNAGGNCVGCHVLSRDGSKMLVTYYPASGLSGHVSGLVDVRSGSTLIDWSAGYHWDFASFFKDGTSFVGSNQGTLTYFQLTSGPPASATAMGTIAQPSGAQGSTMPDVSPDGSQVVFAFTPNGCTTDMNPFGYADWDTSGDGIAVAPVTGTGTFGAPTVLVPPDTSCATQSYYPSFSPDGKWIAFNKSSNSGCSFGAANCNSYSNPTASVYLMPAGGGTSIALANVNAVTPTNSWPRWCPVSGSFAGQPIGWITLSSQRNYGNEIVGQQRSQIWMAAVQPGSSSPDPSYPPFWLPFQDSTTPNHIAQWTTAVIH